MNIKLTLHNISIPVLLALLIVYIVWGSTYLVIRFTIDSIPPFMLTGGRSFLAGISLVAIALMRKQTIPSKAQTWNAILVGAIMFGGGAGLVAFSEKWVESGLTALGVAATPIWAAIFVGLWGKWPNRLEWIGLLIGLIGIVILNMENGMRGNPIGAMALIVGPMMWAFASMWSRRLNMPDGFMSAAFQLLGGAFVLVFISYFTGESMTTFPTKQAVFGFFYLTIISSLITFTAYIYLVRTVRPSLATSYAYVNPVIAVMLGVFFADESITTTGIVAMIVILTGVALLAFGKERKKPEALQATLSKA
ncbi:MAG: drug/metabolite exporter YedA [Anaerolineae bacterium]|nr:drug/metabolite exporter YedA [Anaerolineae bacterium]